MSSKTIIHEFPDGTKVEYRRRADLPAVFALENRVLKPNGTPHADGWYPVDDRDFVQLQDCGTGVIEALRSAE